MQYGNIGHYKKRNQADDLKQLEEDFYRKVNQVISTKITPIYNMCLLIFVAFFGYFAFTNQNQCYARDGSAWAV